MDKHNEQFDRFTKLTFGPEAHLGGDFGGELRILVSGSVIGTGGTFAEALQAARKSARRELSTKGDTLDAAG